MVVKADLAESEAEFQDEFVKELQRYIKNIKESREMGERFMLFEELLKDEREEGRAEGRADSVLTLLEEKGEISSVLREKITTEKNMDVLESWIKLAAKAQSIEQFSKEM